MISMSWPEFRRGQVRVNGRPILLSRLEHRLVVYLLIHRGRVCSVAELIDYVWPDPDSSPEMEYSNLMLIIWRLRRKLGRAAITHLWGRGFLIER